MADNHDDYGAMFWPGACVTIKPRLAREAFGIIADALEAAQEREEAR